MFGWWFLVDLECKYDYIKMSWSWHKFWILMFCPNVGHQIRTKQPVRKWGYFSHFDSLRLLLGTTQEKKQESKSDGNNRQRRRCTACSTLILIIKKQDSRTQCKQYSSFSLVFYLVSMRILRRIVPLFDSRGQPPTSFFFSRARVHN